MIVRMFLASANEDFERGLASYLVICEVSNENGAVMGRAIAGWNGSLDDQAEGLREAQRLAFEQAKALADKFYQPPLAQAPAPAQAQASAPAEGDGEAWRRADHPLLHRCTAHGVEWRKGQYGPYHPIAGGGICDFRKTVRGLVDGLVQAAAVARNEAPDALRERLEAKGFAKLAPADKVRMLAYITQGGRL